ncbi:MAG: GDP-mannose 4,6-dehydratase [Candidatus Eisenbacteria bacterium]
MNVLITGASGFVGPHLARAVRTAGGRVFGTGLEAAAPAALAGDAALERYAAWDVAQGPEGGAQALAWGADAIVHLAGQASAARSFEDPEATFAANARGTLALLEAARRARFAGPVLVVSSSEVYGRLEPGRPAREDDTIAPVSPYGASKAAAEALAQAYARGYGLRVVIARSFSHTGPGQGPAFALASWARQIAAAEAQQARGGKGPFRLAVGNLSPVRDYSDVRDVVRAYLVLLEHGAGATAYNVASGRGVALGDALALLTARARTPIEVVEDPARLRPADLTYLVGDPARLVALGFEARHALEETFEALLDGARRDEAASPTGGA